MPTIHVSNLSELPDLVRIPIAGTDAMLSVRVDWQSLLTGLARSALRSKRRVSTTYHGALRATVSMPPVAGMPSRHGIEVPAPPTRS